MEIRRHTLPDESSMRHHHSKLSTHRLNQCITVSHHRSHWSQVASHSLTRISLATVLKL
jgi:hypothetical protein